MLSQGRDMAYIVEHFHMDLALAGALFDYHCLLPESGWNVTHRIECPLSSERFINFQVHRMQAKKILGTVSRSLLLAKREK